MDARRRNGRPELVLVARPSSRDGAAFLICRPDENQLKCALYTKRRKNLLMERSFPPRRGAQRKKTPDFTPKPFRLLRRDSICQTGLVKGAIRRSGRPTRGGHLLTCQVN